VIGVDVGGTKILSGVVDRGGNILQRNLVESPGTSEQDLLAALDSAVEMLLDDGIGGIGFGVPANLERGTGRILRSTNLQLDDFDLAAHARARFGVPVGVENDANAATLAEWKLGAGRGTSNLIMLTLGTGVGGGIVHDGRLYRGWAEIGHMVVQVGGPPCPGNCHGRGHLEALASGQAADRVARELWGPDADARTLVERAAEGVDEALAALDDLAEALGAAIGSLANIFDPEVVIIGGGFGEAVELILAPAQEAARREALEPADSKLRVVSAELGADAGLVGAGLLGFEALDGAW
jgi:glucokinase